MLCPRVCDDLPVVLTIHERSIWYHSSEEIVSLVQECVTAVCWEINLFRRVVTVPTELMDVQKEIEEFHVDGLAYNFDGLGISGYLIFVFFLVIHLAGTVKRF